MLKCIKIDLKRWILDTNVIVALGLVVLAFVILYLMSKNEKKKNIASMQNNHSKSSNETISKSEIESFEFENLENLRFPHLIETMRHNDLAKAYEVVYDTFSFLDYPNKTNDEIMNKEWHSWQLAILLKYLSKKTVFIKPNALDMIPNEIRNLSKNALSLELKLLVKRYFHTVDIHESKEKLCNQLEWNARDIAIILMCIINEEKSK